MFRGRPQQTGLCERLIGTVKNMINKMASDNPKSWHKLVGFVLWAIRETPNETTGVPPALLAWGRVPRGPLAILKDTMTGKVELPLNLGKTASEYLEELKRNLRLKIMLRHIPKRLSNDTFRGIICEPEKSRLRLDRKFWF